MQRVIVALVSDVAAHVRPSLALTLALALALARIPALILRSSGRGKGWMRRGRGPRGRRHG